MELFKIDQLIVYPGAKEILRLAGKQAGEFVKRHQNGDWGESKMDHETALLHGYLLESVYSIKGKGRLKVITHAGVLGASRVTEVSKT